MSLVSEIVTQQESINTDGSTETATMQFRSRVRTNIDEPRIRARLQRLGLMDHVEELRPIAMSWFWIGIGGGYEILWRTTTTWDDLRPLSQL